MSHEYLPETVTREQVDALPGATVLQFGTNWCGYCRAAQAVIEPVLEGSENVRRILVEDGKGRPLGRSYRVKLWPTLVFLADGVEVARVVRPWKSDDVTTAVSELDAALSR
jgi:thioredoxin 1